MDVLQAEHQETWRRSQLPNTVDEAQRIIEALQRSRDVIANGMRSQSSFMAVLNTVQILHRSR